ncbi:MAG: hypothetical protein EPN85_06935 [Bacteroidetes bacterium]|nr:MAG: hypothetical protein EPN85_06935 [Bacteroidota bacterium]
MISQKEFGGMFEYRLRKHFSLEVGGGVNVPLSFPWETSNTGVRFTVGEGFTIRTGARFYSKSRMYFNPMIFYRQMTYRDRYYGYPDQGSFGGIDEPRYRAKGLREDYYIKIVDEYKQVFSVQVLFGLGRELFKRFIVDMYVGIGGRYKYKQKGIIYDNYYLRGQLQQSTYYSPPKKEKADGYVPTIQAGIQIGILKWEKHSI